MSILDDITPEEIERAVRESPIIRAAVMAEREWCAGIAESASRELCISPGCDCDYIAFKIREGPQAASKRTEEK